MRLLPDAPGVTPYRARVHRERRREDAGIERAVLPGREQRGADLRVGLHPLLQQVKDLARDDLRLHLLRDRWLRGRIALRETARPALIRVNPVERHVADQPFEAGREAPRDRLVELPRPVEEVPVEDRDIHLLVDVREVCVRRPEPVRQRPLDGPRHERVVVPLQLFDRCRDVHSYASILSTSRSSMTLDAHPRITRCGCWGRWCVLQGALHFTSAACRHFPRKCTVICFVCRL